MALTNQEIQALADALGRAIGGNTTRTSSYNANSRQKDKIKTLDELEESLKHNASIANNLSESFKKMKMSMKGLGDVYDKLERSTRKYNDSSRKLNDIIVEQLRTSKNQVETLKSFQNQSSSLNKALNGFTEKVKTYNKTVDNLKDLEKEKKRINREINKLTEEYKKKKKSKKSTDAIKTKMEEAAKKLVAIQENILKVNDLKTDLDNSVKVIKEFGKTYADLNDAQLDQIENYESLDTEQKEYIESIEKLKAASKDLSDRVSTTSQIIDEKGKKISKAFDDVRSGLKKAGFDLLTKAPVVAYGDLLSQLRNNVRNSDYEHDALMGVSETERSNLIGENRIGLRVLGQGDSEQGFRNAGIIQNAANQYGVVGADAIKLGLQYQNSLINSGFGGGAKDTADQMTVMHNFAKDLGITDESLKGFYDSLQDMGQMAQLQQKYANLDDQSRRKAINEEIKSRIALSTQLGISIDRQKQLNQESINKQYGGIAKSILGNIGAKMEITQYNKDNPTSKLTKAEQEAYVIGQSRGPNTLNKSQLAAWETAQQKISGNRSSQLSKAARTSQTAFNSASVKYIDSMVPIIGNPQERDVTANNEALRRKSLAGTGIINNRSYEENQKDIINQTNNAFIDLIPSMQNFNQEIIKSGQLLHGAAVNPAGAAAGTALNAVGSFGGSLLGSAIGTGGAMAVAEIAGTVAAVLGAGVVGIAIGSLINKYLLTNDDGTQNKAGTIIGNSVLLPAASMGITSAQEALLGQAQGDYFDSDEGKRAREAHRAEFARKFEAKWGHPPGEPASSPVNRVNLSEFTKLNDELLGSPHSADETVEILKKMQKVLEDQLNIQKKDQNDKDKEKIAEGGTLKALTDHVMDTRKGLKG